MDNEARGHLAHIGSETLAQAEALEGQLAPAQFEQVLRLVREVDDAVAQHAQREQDRIIEGIAAHLGCLGPAIRALASHVDPESPADRCRDGCRGRWPASGSHADSPEQGQ